MESGSGTSTAEIHSFQRTWNELKTEQLDLLHVNCEGCEFQILNGIFGQASIISNIKTIQFGTHLIPRYEKNILEMYCGLIRSLSKSHHIIFQAPFIWERWQLNQ